MLHVALAVLWPVVLAQSSTSEPAAPEKKLVEFDPAPLDSGAADFPAWSVGVGVDVWTGFGSIFNDVVGPSFRAGHRIDERWGVSLSIFKTDFDFEDPAEFVFDRENTPVSDASIDMLMVSATAQWHFLEPGGRFDFYVGAGLGLAFPGTGEAVNNPLVDIEVDGNFGPEVHIAVGGAVRVIEQFHITLELRLMQSFTEYDVEDRQTGEQETENGWTGIGLSFGADWRF